jgi:hypothetical protein
VDYRGIRLGIYEGGVNVPGAAPSKVSGCLFCGLQGSSNLLTRLYMQREGEREADSRSVYCDRYYSYDYDARRDGGDDERWMRETEIDAKPMIRVTDMTSSWP